MRIYAALAEKERRLTHPGTYHPIGSHAAIAAWLSGHQPLMRDSRWLQRRVRLIVIKIVPLVEGAMTEWRIEGEYMETCNCEFICPCIGTNLAGRPTEGDCKAAIAMRIDRGEKDGVSLDGLSFIVVMRSPGPMGDGNIKVGLIVDEKASDAQVEAIGDIASGAAGGPMAALAPLVSEFAGIERRPISFEIDDMTRAVAAGELIDQAIVGVPSLSKEGEPMYLENTAHPVSARLALANATRSRFNVFGIQWDDSSGSRNGHFAPFSWAA